MSIYFDMTFHKESCSLISINNSKSIHNYMIQVILLSPFMNEEMQVTYLYKIS